ncbi:type IV pilus assembly protein PilW [Marinobacter sp. 3-2]|jgi:type IV pilus assembly protein PilW|uniref:PilW family protein n=1 Tax=Marinobacter sp. 3-2 TaxID=2485141 RepID=UPI000D3AFBD0|nr:PilW family protein [Marinobacter sp. 3-2]ROQ38809.1 type IV pilus assembly protein PilW [Marinobacter sp. 3-2]
MRISASQAGLSIIEVIVALALSLIITLGLTQIFTSNSQSFRVSEASARIQETGRLATSIIGREIRNASYWGCLGSQGVRDGRLNSILNDTGFDVGALLRGLDAENDSGVDNSDILYLGGVNGNSQISVTFQPSQQAANLQVDDSDSFNLNDILIVTNCSQGDIFQITNLNTNNEVVVHNSGNVSDGPGNSTQALSTNYNDDPNGASVFRPRQQRFYLQDNGNGTRELVTDGVGISGSGIGNFSTPVALLQDVIDFQIQFGVDSNQNGQVNNWEDPIGLTVAGRTQADNTIAVRISVLVRSPNDGVTDGEQEYCFPGWLDCVANAGLLTTSNANDTFLYRVYSTTISMRNRI